ncbi:MAG: hypothetical protein LBP19_09295 [Treponema sp.]|nr:hypothetical protein [Treponema sp.]
MRQGGGFAAQGGKDGVHAVRADNLSRRGGGGSGGKFLAVGVTGRGVPAQVFFEGVGFDIRGAVGKDKRLTTMSGR